MASLGSVYPKDTEAPPAGVDDMTKLAYLHEPGVLHNLSCRYGLNEIYVSTFACHPGCGDPACPQLFQASNPTDTRP